MHSGHCQNSISCAVSFLECEQAGEMWYDRSQVLQKRVGSSRRHDQQKLSDSVWKWFGKYEINDAVFPHAENSMFNSLKRVLNVELVLNFKTRWSLIKIDTWSEEKNGYNFGGHLWHLNAHCERKTSSNQNDVEIEILSMKKQTYLPLFRVTMWKKYYSNENSKQIRLKKHLKSILIYI